MAIARSLDRLDFDAHLMLGRFLFEKGNFFASLVYLNISERLAYTDTELAQVYYWSVLLASPGPGKL